MKMEHQHEVTEDPAVISEFEAQVLDMDQKKLVPVGTLSNLI